MNLQDLAQRIRGQREKRGLKQQDLANALHVSPQAVSKWERGENAPDIAVLAPLSKLLGVSVDWLLAANDEQLDVFQAAVLVSSVHGAYEKSLHMKPRDFAIWANGLFYQLTEVTLRNDGVPIKYMGDRFLSFYAGTNAGLRAARTAFESKVLVGPELKVGLSFGEVYLGSVGHPDYARPDIMGEVVNIAFLTTDWAHEKTKSGVAATGLFVDQLAGSAKTGKKENAKFLGLDRPVDIYELKSI